MSARSEIRFGGAGGQGLILSARILFQALSAEGRHVAQSQSYEPTSRGGFCHSDLVVDDDAVDFPLVSALDCLILLDQVGVKPSVEFLGAHSLVIADERHAPQPPRNVGEVLTLPLSRRAIELGNERVTNIVALGALVAKTALCSREALMEAVERETPRGFRALNQDALRAGFELVDGAQAGQSGKA